MNNSNPLFTLEMVRVAGLTPGFARLKSLALPHSVALERSLFECSQNILATFAPSRVQVPHRSECKKIPTRRPVFSSWSEWRDLNPRPLDPQSSTLPNCATPGYPCSQAARYKKLERKTRFELATLALARRCSTPEPLPHKCRHHRRRILV